MPFYKLLNNKSEAGRRTLERLLRLREQLDRDIPRKTATENMLLATWNIREFDSPAYGDRINEAFYYIAEIISRFDLVAIQEVREDLVALNRLMQILGSQWSVIFSGVTEGQKGNGERMAFVYDKNKVRFGGMMGQMVLPPVKVINEQGEKVEVPAVQIVRTPLTCGFKVGWTDFILTTVHILYGDDKADNPLRVEEIRQVAQFLKRRSEEKTEWSRNLILLGDFNIYDQSDQTMKALTDAGFVIPEELQGHPTNAIKTKHYDQIAFKIRPEKFGTTGKAGVFDYFETVFHEDDELIYKEYMGTAYEETSSGKPRKNKSTYYKTYWRTYQMSDHLPMWVELKVDYSDEYLEGKLDET